MRTAEQLRHIESLRESLGWTPAGVDDLCRRIAGAPLANVASARDASRVIVAMQNIVRWRQGKAQERRPGGYDPFERLAQRAEAEMPDIMDKLVEASRVEYAL